MVTCGFEQLVVCGDMTKPCLAKLSLSGPECVGILFNSFHPTQVKIIGFGFGFKTRMSKCRHFDIFFDSNIIERSSWEMFCQLLFHS